jgi:hypothetical protein
VREQRQKKKEKDNVGSDCGEFDGFDDDDSDDDDSDEDGGTCVDICDDAMVMVIGMMIMVMATIFVIRW